MSKSGGNVVDPWQVIREYGADAVRLYLIASSQVWLPQALRPRRRFRRSRGGFFDTLRQTYRFFALYAGEFAPGAGAARAAARPALDRWLLSRLDATVGRGDGGLGAATTRRPACGRS